MAGRLAGFCVGNPTKNNAKKFNISIFRRAKAKNIHPFAGGYFRIFDFIRTPSCRRGRWDKF